MNNPIIVALDVPGARQALELVDRIGDAVRFYKVGLELYAGEGPQFVQELLARGCRVFLDLKFYDIAETVRRATVRVAGLGVSLLTVHGSVPVMQAAVEGRGAGELKLLAVTVLTSFDYEDLNDMGYFCSVADLVEHRVRRAAQAGVDGVVCSPLEVAVVREIMGPGAILVTPGVRSAGKESGGQKRVATPQEAIRDGANYLVIGRQITRAADPRSEVLKILAELGTPVVGR